MINEPFQVTFGVELEMILAFHQDLLERHLRDTHIDSQIIKSVPENVRIDLNVANKVYWPERQTYRGWALTSHTTYGDVDYERQEFFLDCLAKYGYRGYAGEILSLAKTLLPRDVRVHDSMATEYTDYRYWHLTHDNSLIGMSKEELSSNLFSFIDFHTDDEDIDNWDSQGIELVFRVLPFTPSSFSEISTQLTPLRGTPSSQHAAFATDCCGLHIHVGLPTPPDHEEGTPLPTFDLPTLQHLAYIQAMYDPSIRMLFPKSRREGRIATDVDLKSNLEAFLEEETESSLPSWDSERDTYHSDNGDDSLTPAPFIAPASPSDSNDKPVCPTIPFHAIRAKIFAKDMTVEKLAELMCPASRTHVINYRNVLRTEGPRTIEFRQHEGTTDPEAVKWWVTFVVGLVRLAESRGRIWNGYST